MGLVSRNVVIVLALLVALHAASAAPANKGEGKGEKGGKGRRSVAEEQEGDASWLEGPFADPLAQDAQEALALEEQVRVRRAVQQAPAQDAALAQDEVAADGLMSKKPCKGKEGKSDDAKGSETTAEATTPSALVNWMMMDDGRW